MTTNNIPSPAPPPPLDVARVDVQWRAEALAEFETSKGIRVAAHLVETTLAALWLMAMLRMLGVMEWKREAAMTMLHVACVRGADPWETAENVSRACTKKWVRVVVPDAPA